MNRRFFIDGQYSQTAQGSPKLAFGKVSGEPILQTRRRIDYFPFEGFIDEGNEAESYIIDADGEKAKVYDFSLDSSGNLSFKKKYPEHAYVLHYEMVLSANDTYEGKWVAGNEHGGLPLTDGEGRAICTLTPLNNLLT